MVVSCLLHGLGTQLVSTPQRSEGKMLTEDDESSIRVLFQDLECRGLIIILPQATRFLEKPVLVLKVGG